MPLRLPLIGLAILLGAAFTLSIFEKWRGQRAWDRTRSELESMGLRTDWQQARPQAIPEANNLALARVMTDCIRMTSNHDQLGDWQAEPIFDEQATEAASAAQELFAPSESRKHQAFGFAQSDLESLDIFGKTHADKFTQLTRILHPYRSALAELRAACDERSSSYLPGDYTVAAASPIPDFELLRTVTRLLTAEALLALRTGESGLALENCHALLRISNLNPQVPFLINVMIETIVIRSSISEILYYGLVHDVFDTHQLAEILTLCAPIDCINRLGQSFEFEMLTMSNSIKAFFEDPVELTHLFGSDGVPLLLGSNMWVVNDSLVSALWHFVPAKGWNLQMLARSLNFTSQYYSAFDLAAGTVDLKKLESMHLEMERLETEGDFFDTLLLITVPAYGNVAETAVNTQRRIDLIVIAAQLILSAKQGVPLPQEITAQLASRTDPANKQIYHYTQSADGFILSNSDKGDSITDNEDDLVIHWAPRD
ncbi:hypothetical protein SH580_08755 [Coraliomargarita algicola]|uniref:Uncharacterized protein n=1 Tax=Coraliomargarita algicola TaxID=3092156 RepID=A0ABZ0RNJ0_9BACT|nr:hypothetical protein [Coraliomargarita sp. J2-16]WPJ97800.1 hypothetical protein SH580_08755 [Coraliomargarita sp. J2-16]